MRALLSVANREGIAAFARDLRALEIDVVATDGTREFLAAEGVEVGSVSDLTQVPALVGGQVKTFHPAVYAGILARRDVPEQLAELEAQGIGLIDLVVVNVKPFAPAVGARLVGIDEAIELIDVGGAALLGAAARNAAGVAAVADPAHYTSVIDEIRKLGQCSPELRARLAAEAFSTVAAYHAEIAAYLNQIAGNVFPSRLALVLEKVDDLRYGENPHQRAAFYRETTHRSAHARRRRPAAGQSALVQQPARPRRGVPDRARLHRPHRRDRQAHRPGRAGLERGARRGLPARPRDRPGRVVRRHRRGEPGARRRHRPRDRRQLVRGGRRPGLQPGGARHPQGEVRPRAAGRAARPDRRDARLRDRQPRLQAGRRRPARRGPRRARARSRPSPGRDHAAARRSRS